MNQKETNIIAKLVKIAEKQQKIISDLVQKVAQESDPLTAYLTRAANVTGVNNGMQGSAQVSMDSEGFYTVQMSGIPENNALKQKIIDEFLIYRRRSSRRGQEFNIT